eukprot:Nk52_evm24s2462 gene=Nk52_evmTU24s2462
MLLGRRRGGLQCGGRLKVRLHGLRERLREGLREEMEAHGVETVKELLPEVCREENMTRIPRYVRVNTILCSMQQCVDEFVKDGFEEVPYKQIFSTSTPPSSTRCFARDIHVDSLLVFPSGTDLHAHRLYTSGAFIFQDKASCFPAQALMEECTDLVKATSDKDTGSVTFDAMDACAAPGNKTTHLAALLATNDLRSRVHAFDIDAKRLETMRTLVDKAHCGAPLKGSKSDKKRKVQIETHCKSFLETDNSREGPYGGVKVIVVDPSCSGSGIVNRMEDVISYNLLKKNDDDENENDTKGKNSDTDERLASLASFQISCVRHAMSFPGVQRVVYSTCSVHEEENEMVVAALMSGKDGKRFRLRRAKLNGWVTRGHFPTRMQWPGATGGEQLPVLEKKAIEGIDFTKCIRSDPSVDKTIGFFVAVFERINTNDCNGDEVEVAPVLATTASGKRQEEIQGTVETLGSEKEEASVASAVPDGNSNVKLGSNTADEKSKKKKKSKAKRRVVRGVSIRAPVTMK